MVLTRAVLPAALLAVIAIGVVDAARPADPQALAQQILQDGRLPHVLGMARALLRDNLTAGDGYSEVWIRDLNTFIELSLEVNDRQPIRGALLNFLALQRDDGDIPDGYVRAEPRTGQAVDRTSRAARGLVAHKNTVETDQESSLVQAVARYVESTGDRSILDETVAGLTVRDRLARALDYVRTSRMDARYGLVWGATTADWGDLQPEEATGTALNAASHRSIDVYDNAMFVIGLDDYLRVVHSGQAAGADGRGTTSDARRWASLRDAIVQNVRASLWDASRQQFVAHLYPDPAGSPFPPSFDERAVYVHGGTAVAIEAGLLTGAETAAALERMRADVRAAGSGSIGLSQYPPYPSGAFARPGMEPFMYQNGGDWSWFGGRMVQQLIRQGLVADAYRELLPMIVRVERVGDFAEWWTRDDQPRGSGAFRGSAGTLGRAIEMLEAWARSHRATHQAISGG